MNRPHLLALFFVSIVCLILNAALADSITLSSGETLVGTITEHTDKQVVLQHPILGKLRIPADKVTKIELTAKPTQAESTPVTPTEQAPSEPTEQPATKPFRFFDGWQAQLEIGGSGTRGNSDTVNFRAAFNAKKETKTDRWQFDTAYYYSSSNSNTTNNQYTAGLVKDWLLLDSKWFYYAQGRYDHDQFQSWTHRVSAGGGLGYQWIKTDSLSVLTRAGLGGAKEFGGSNDLRPEAQLGGEVSWKIDDTQSLDATTYYYPDLVDIQQYRIRSTAGWTLKLSQFDGVALKFGLENEYQSQVETGTKHNDLKVFGALVVDF